MGKRDREKVYKLVSRVRSSDSLVSIAAPDIYRVSYPVGERVYPPEGTKLFVFRDLEDAVSFANSDLGLTFSPLSVLTTEVWRAYASGVERIERIAFTTRWAVRRFWQDEWRSTKKAPAGSYICDWVELVDKVEIEVDERGKGRIKDG